MLKNILNLEGAQQLSNNEQKEINGGIPSGCAYQTWSGGSLANCKVTNPGGFNYSYMSGTCRAFFCSPVDPIEIFVP
ncbi:hypothetical protein [Flavobacterium polysaccharolyticum]|uniref:Natural product n=1 Tax=Flavobacterium polysaccharolyticum TaxID=3133148 RepID=A0ABU9NL95_9FLAO